MKKNIKAFIRGGLLGAFVLAAALVVSNPSNLDVSACESPEVCYQDPSECGEPTPTPTPDPLPTPPAFPSCLDQEGIGDYTHYDYGWHQIVGNGLVEGEDDVYSLEDGNFLQCFCSVDGDGIETIWWRIDGMEQSVIDQFLSQGWHLENGSQWNLGDYTYLAKNVEYVCKEPTPTPTPTPTSTPTPTPTPDDEPESRCSSLSASPTEGSAPLTVRFNGSGFDEDGEIKRYRFDFGDSSGGQEQVWEQDESEAFHRYEHPGTYIAALHVKDSRGNWRNGQADCRIEITVNDEPEVLGVTTVTELPKTGAPALFGLGLLTAGSLGAYLYRRFRLV